jgi:hypothetical protein
MSYYSGLFDATLKEEPSEEREDVLTTIAHCATELYPEELYDKIKDAFENGLIDEFLVDLEEIDEKMAEGKDAVMPRLRENRHYHLVESGIEEMEWWAWYRESDDDEVDEGFDDPRDLSIEEIMEKFFLDSQVFPRHALRQAVEKKNEITPYLLKALELAAEDPEEVLEVSDDTHIYAMFLLAQFREKRAYPLIIKLASHRPEVADALLGNIPTEDLANILASVSMGDTSLITELAANKDAEEFMRASALRAWLALVVSGERSREEAVAYYKSLFEEDWKTETRLCGANWWTPPTTCFPKRSTTILRRPTMTGWLMNILSIRIGWTRRLRPAKKRSWPIFLNGIIWSRM